jgi:hypothetical protein
MSSATANTAQKPRNFYNGHSDLAVFQDVIGTAHLDGSPSETNGIIVITIDIQTWGTYFPPRGRNIFCTLP